MPTVCSACGRTSGRCQSCIRADAIINEHENQVARTILRRALNTMAPDPAPEAAKAPDPDPSMPLT